MTKQVLVAFQIGKCKDEVVCDVVPMQAEHLLLGRPWQFDRRVKRHGFTNKYSFVVREDQVRLQKESEQHKKSEKEREVEEEKREKAMIDSAIEVKTEKTKEFLCKGQRN